MSDEDRPTPVELIREPVDVVGDKDDSIEQRGDVNVGNDLRPSTAILLVLAIFGGALWLLNGGAERGVADESEQSVADPDSGVQSDTDLQRADSEQLAAVLLAQSLPEELLAVELFASSPDAETVRSLLEAIGGVDALVVGTAEGSFDLVSFNPNDLDELVASQRSSYGLAESQDFNQRWILESGAVDQALFASDIVHDIAHFNADGSLAVWSNPETTSRFGPRTVTLGDNPSNGGPSTSDPLYASRSVIVDGTLFALTSSGDYYSTSRTYQSLIADSGNGPAVLDSGEGWAWVDSPVEGLVVAYPVDASGSTAVWSTKTLKPLENHELAGLTYQRLAVSDDKSTVVGITFDNTIEVISTTSGPGPGTEFGAVDPTGIAQPITLSAAGNIAVTVDWAGAVQLWWVGHTHPIVSIDASAGPSRVLSEIRAPRSSSAVAPDSTRVAVKSTATPDRPTTWSIIETDVARWVERACASTDRRLTQAERAQLGLGRTGPCQVPRGAYTTHDFHRAERQAATAKG